MKSSKRIQDNILKLLGQRGAGKSICPSEVARNLFPDEWREHMEEVRTVARGMKEVVITQGGSPVTGDPKGPIRIALFDPSRD